MNSDFKLFPITTHAEGIWMEPGKACKYWRNGKGISAKRLMNIIYSGALHGKVKRDHTGWYVLVPFHAIEQKEKQPLKAA